MDEFRALAEHERCAVLPVPVTASGDYEHIRIALAPSVGSEDTYNPCGSGGAIALVIAGIAILSSPQPSQPAEKTDSEKPQSTLL